MNLCLKDAFSSQSFNKTYEYSFTSDQLGDLPAPLVSDAVKVTLNVVGENQYVVCNATILGDFSVNCSRCAKEYTLNFECTTQKPVLRDDGVLDQDAIYLNGAYCFNVLDEVYAQLNFEFPMAPLCSDNCKGLCPVCGCDLNVQQCSCDIRTVDPRLAVLKTLFDK